VCSYWFTPAREAFEAPRVAPLLRIIYSVLS
jgi:hypothetical protein